MKRLEIMEMLNNFNIQYSIVNHPPAKTIEEIESFHLPDSETIVKNLFLRDDKKKNYYLVAVRKDKTVNLKELRNLLGTRPLSFASENDLSIYLNLEKGSVTPFGILNDTEHRICLVIDQDIMRFSMIGIHPNENTATLWLSPYDLRTVIEKWGNRVICIKM
ncbi:MAG: prolyl-tRNA synthetase associated domain-containing protein [Clostridium sp.]|nr:prolyl-tRNA synthetase associated domain-containing protein [Clostridium sp.]